MVAEARACAAKERSGPSISPCADFATHLTPPRSGTAEESTKERLQEDDVPACNYRERPRTKGLGKNTEIKYASKQPLDGEGRVRSPVSQILEGWANIS